MRRFSATEEKFSYFFRWKNVSNLTEGDRLERARNLLSREIDRPVELRVKIIPIDIIKIPPRSL